MDDFATPLPLELDICSLTMVLVSTASATGAEGPLADALETALRTVAHLHVDRVGDTVVARTETGHAERVVVVGHLDTAPFDGEALASVELGDLAGPGASDAKGALAMMVAAATAGGYRCDVTFVFAAGGRDAEGSDGWGGVDPAQAEFVLLAEPTRSAVIGGALDQPWATSLIGLTDVEPVSDAAGAHGLAHLAVLGVPAVAFGPGDPAVAGTPGEFVTTAALSRCEYILRRWLTVAS